MDEVAQGGEDLGGSSPILPESLVVVEFTDRGF